jgi:hypothetical protein
MVVITYFLMATFSPESVTVAKMTLPYVPSPSCFMNVYRFMVNSIPDTITVSYIGLKYSGYQVKVA